jgi:hypothetical protein
VHRHHHAMSLCVLYELTEVLINHQMSPHRRSAPQHPMVPDCTPRPSRFGAIPVWSA